MSRHRPSYKRQPRFKGDSSDPATFSYPIQISLPDGEERHRKHGAPLRHNYGIQQEAEMVRGYLKPPENKCLFDLDVETLRASTRSCSVGVLESGLDEGYIPWRRRRVPNLTTASPSSCSVNRYHKNKRRTAASSNRYSTPCESGGIGSQCTFVAGVIRHHCGCGSGSMRSPSSSGSTSTSCSFLSSDSSDSSRSLEFSTRRTRDLTSREERDGKSSPVPSTPTGRKNFQFFPSFLKEPHKRKARKDGINSSKSSSSTLADLPVVSCGVADPPYQFIQTKDLQASIQSGASFISSNGNISVKSVQNFSPKVEKTTSKLQNVDPKEEKSTSETQNLDTKIKESTNLQKINPKIEKSTPEDGKPMDFSQNPTKWKEKTSEENNSARENIAFSKEDSFHEQYIDYSKVEDLKHSPEPVSSSDPSQICHRSSDINVSHVESSKELVRNSKELILGSQNKLVESCAEMVRSCGEVVKSSKMFARTPEELLGSSKTRQSSLT